MKRSLTLHRETLAELATGDLAAIVGAAGIATSPLTQCVISKALTGCGSSVNPKCPGLDA